MGNNLVLFGSSRAYKVICSRVEITEIIVHEADEPNPLVHFLYVEPLTAEG